MDYSEAKKRILAAQKFASGTGINKETFEAIRNLVKGIHPRMDEILNTCSEQLSTCEKYQKGENLELTLEAIPETNEQHKKHKKALLLFLKHWKELQSEIHRVQGELDATKPHQRPTDQIKTFGRIASLARGPLGITTLIAVGVVVVIASRQKTAPSQAAPVPSSIKQQYLLIRGYKVPFSEFYIGTGTDCDAAHYHAKNTISVTAVDGTVLPDPGGCGFGKVASISQVTE